MENCIYFRWPVKDQNMFRCCMLEIEGRAYYLNDFHIEEHKLVDDKLYLKLIPPDDCPVDSEEMFYYIREHEKEYDDYLGEWHDYGNQTKAK